MAHIVPAELELLRQAAELRAEGKPWKNVATELETDHGQLRQLAAQHARTYGSLSRHANREAWHNTMNESVGSLRNLLKSPKEEVVMAVGLAFLKYDLGKMRRATQKERACTQARYQRLRDELPPPPSRGVTAESTRCDSVRPEPEVEEGQEVIEKSTVVQNARCDSVTVTSGRVIFEPWPVRLIPPMAAPTPPQPAAQPVPKKVGPPRQSPTTAALRRKKWLPVVLRK